MNTTIDDLHATITAVIGEVMGVKAATMVVPDTWYATVAVLNKKMFATTLTRSDETGFDVDVSADTGMTIVKITYTGTEMPNADGVVETVRNRAELFLEKHS